MLARLFLLFTLVPLVELALLIRIGGWLGALPTVALVAATGLAGAWLARREGTRSWTAVRRELSGGRVPGRELLHTLTIVVAGALLVTPGVLTDAAGLLLLVRPVRDAVIGRIQDRLARRVANGGIRLFYSSGSRDPNPDARPSEGDADADSGGAWRRREPAERDDDPESDSSGGRVVEM